MPAVQDNTSAESILTEVGARTLALAAEVAGWGPDEVAAPSALPGWSRGHVLAHVAGHADAVRAVLVRAAAGESSSMYPSAQARNAAIEAGATAPPQVLLRRLLESADALASAWRALPEAGLGVRFTAPAGWWREVREIPWLRWREVALHHVDLGTGRAAPPGGPLGSRLVAETLSGFAERSDVPALDVTDTDSGASRRIGPAGPRAVAVEGDSGALALWLTGRSGGAGLAPSEGLPVLPAWL